jgi:hypothetical protein
MNIQKAIKQSGSIESFALKYHLSCKYNDDKSLVTLCYDQLKTPKNPTTNECRGITFDTSTNRIVSYPFYRFHDYDSKKGHKLDFENGVFYEKVDGSLCTLYYYNNQWNISTKMTPTGNGWLSKDNKKTLSDYYFEVFGNTEDLNPNYCYITEFKFPSDNSFLTYCNKPTITLIGVRDMITLKELLHNIFSDRFNVGQRMKFKNEKELWNYIYNLDPIVSEGLVYVNRTKIKEGNYERFKIKSPQYELINLLRTFPREDVEKEKERQRLNEKWLKSICSYNKHRTFLDIDKFKVFKKKVFNIDKEFYYFEDCIINFKDLPLSEINNLEIPQIVKDWFYTKGKYTIQEFLINRYK